MKKMSEMLGIVQQNVEERRTKKTRAAPHEHAATVDLIVEAGLTSKKYNYKYWLGKIHSAGVDFNEMVGILKEIRGMDPKYNKGGRLTNILSERTKQKKNAKKPG